MLFFTKMPLLSRLTRHLIGWTLLLPLAVAFVSFLRELQSARSFRHLWLTCQKRRTATCKRQFLLAAVSGASRRYSSMSKASSSSFPATRVATRPPPL